MQRSLQEWVLWVDQGAGGRWVKRLAWLVAIALVSGTLCYHQFHGPTDERTVAQLVTARMLGEGGGFNTLIHHPQALAMAEARGRGYALDAPVPELYQPPGYEMALGGLFRVLPDAWREKIFHTVLPAPDGFLADYVVLGFNVVLVWLVLGVTWVLASRWFDRDVARWTTWGVLFSGPLWAGTVGGTGVALSALLVATLAWILTLAHQGWGSGGGKWWHLPLAGVLAGMLALVDYTWWIVLPATTAWIWWRAPDARRGAACGFFLVAGLLVVLPWILRNVELTGHPLGLGGQDWVLKAGDPTAEPETWRARLTTELPPVDWAKIGNKLLSHARDVAQGKYWAAYGILGAFALVGCFYRFRSEGVRSMRIWVFGIFILMIASEGVMGTGGEIRPAVTALAPLIVALGAGFFVVLLGSHPFWAERIQAAGALLMLVQAAPLAHDLVEPRGYHYHYPPYHPALFAAFRGEIDQRKSGRWLWQCDVPAGAAWYSGRSVWALPANAEGFLALGSRQPILAVVLTPHTLDRPYFSELARSESSTTPVSWTWPQVFRGLAIGHLPANFPLQRVERFAPNLVVLVDGVGASRVEP